MFRCGTRIPGHTNFSQSGNGKSEKGQVFVWTENSTDGMTGKGKSVLRGNFLELSSRLGS